MIVGGANQAEWNFSDEARKVQGLLLPPGNAPAVQISEQCSLASDNAVRLYCAHSNLKNVAAVLLYQRIQSCVAQCAQQH